jgi:hypothetical protein
LLISVRPSIPKTEAYGDHGEDSHDTEDQTRKAVDEALGGLAASSRPAGESQGL